MNLHGRIMNLNCVPTNMDAEPAQRLAYKVGHRDARHAAAALSMLGDACTDALRSALLVMQGQALPLKLNAIQQAKDALSALDGVAVR